MSSLLNRYNNIYQWISEKKNGRDMNKTFFVMKWGLVGLHAFERFLKPNALFVNKRNIVCNSMTVFDSFSCTLY